MQTTFVFAEGQELEIALSDWFAGQNNMPRRALGTVMRVTEKAIMLRGAATGREVWLPKSQAQVRRVIKDVERHSQIEIDFDVPVADCEFTIVKCIKDHICVWFPKQDLRSYDVIHALEAKYYDHSKCWRLPARIDIAIALNQGFVGTRANLADEAFQDLLREHEGMQQAQWALTCPLEDLPQPDSLKNKLWEHQLRMYHFSRSMSAAGFFMEMGTGKTLTLIATFLDWVRSRNVKSMLIVAPKNVVPVWLEEFEKHSAIPVRVVLLNHENQSVAKRTELAKQTLADARAKNEVIVHVINYESVWRPPFGRKYEKKVSKNGKSYNVLVDPGFALQAGYEMVVLDESHKIKDYTGSAAKFCHELGKVTPNRAILTGTPIVHDVMDIYSQYLFLDPTVFGTSPVAFREQYAVMNFFGGIDGVKNEAELNRKIYSRAFRVTKEVLKLPEAIHTHRDGELSKEEARVYAEMDANMVASIFEMEKAKAKRDLLKHKAYARPNDEDLKRQIAEAGEEVRVRTTLAMTKTMKLAQIACGFVIDEDKKVHDIGNSRLNLLEDVVSEIHKDEPLVIFCRFVEDMRRVKERMSKLGYKVAELSGQVDQLQEWRAGQYTVLVVQIKSGGVGINLTKCGNRMCHYCIYYSKDYDWGQYEQSLSRAHRAGQTETVWYIHLRMADIDYEIEDTLSGRTSLFATLLKRKEFAQKGKKGVA